MKKKKVIIASLALTFSLSVGTVFASVNAGEKLQSWYEGKVQQWESNLIEYSLYQVNGRIYKHADGFVMQFESGFKEFAQSTINTFSQNIKNHTSKYLSDIQNKNTELKKSVETDFNNFVTEKNESVNKRIESEVVKALDEIDSELDSQTEKGLGEVSLNVASGATAAQEQFKEVVNSLKGDIQAQIKTKEEKAVEDVKKSVDETITARKGQIHQYASTYSDEIIEDIQEVSDVLQEEAKTDMLNIILNINK